MIIRRVAVINHPGTNVSPAINRDPVEHGPPVEDNGTRHLIGVGIPRTVEPRVRQRVHVPLGDPVVRRVPAQAPPIERVLGFCNREA